MEGFNVADSDEVLFANVRNDRNIEREVEVDWQGDEFVERKEIFGFNILHMKDEDDLMFVRAVNERCFQFVKA